MACSRCQQPGCTTDLRDDLSTNRLQSCICFPCPPQGSLRRRDDKPVYKPPQWKSVHTLCPSNVCGPSKSQTPSKTKTNSRTRTSSASKPKSAPYSQTRSRTSSPPPNSQLLNPNAYSGSSSSRDPCSRGLEALYSFGPTAGDTRGAKGDDVAHALTWTGFPFKYYGVSYNSLYPNTNGVSGWVTKHLDCWLPVGK